MIPSDKKKTIWFVAALLILAIVCLFLMMPTANGEEVVPVITIEKVFDVTPYLVGLLSLLTLFISTWLVPMLKSKTTKEQQEIIQAIVNTVVYAAEQLFGSHSGKQKLEYATNHAIERLKQIGIKLDADALRPYIEGAVKALNLKQGESIPEEDPVPGLAEFIRSDDEGK